MRLRRAVAVLAVCGLVLGLGAHDAAAVDEEVRRAVGGELLGEVLVRLDLGLVGVAVERGRSEERGPRRR